MFAPHLKRWQLRPDGTALHTRGADLLPVQRADGRPAMLKRSRAAEEQAGNALMVWWNGDGSAPVLAHNDPALLMARADTHPSLASMARSGKQALDDEATRILCATAARLHAPRHKPLPELVPLTVWFRAVWPAAALQGGILQHAAHTAQALLAEPRSAVVLHGDLHHGNVLHFGAAGWLAIDPKGLSGERGFDHANLLRNPDAESALAPGRFAHRIEHIVQTTGLERQRLLQWVLAWCGLSAVWMLEDGEAPDHTLAVGRLAAAALDLSGGVAGG